MGILSFYKSSKLLIKIFCSKPAFFISICSMTNLKQIFRVIFILPSSERDIRLLQLKAMYLSNESTETSSPINLAHVNREFPVFASIDVSVIVPVYNQWDLTDDCLKSIINSVKNVNYEVILADDGSSDKTLQAAKIYKNLIVARPEKNLGFLLNCNHAAKYANGRYIVLLNNDTVVHNHWLEALFDKMEKDQKIAICGSKLVYPDGKLQEAGGIIWDDASGWNYGRMDDPSKPEYCYCKEVDYISGASIMIRTDFWHELEGFDERYVPAYYEDADLALEAKSRGYKVVFHPHSVVTHFEGQSHGTDESSGIKAYQLENQKKFREKWHEKLKQEHFANAQNVFQARDHSANKRTVVVIDHYVPWFDKDAGSRSIFMHLKFLVEQGYNVKFIGDNFYPHQPYTDVLNEMGIEVLYGQYYAENWKEWLKDNTKNIDVVWLNRPHIAEKYIDFIKEHLSAKIIYQCIDLHFLRLERQYQQTNDQKCLDDAAYWKKIELELFSKADLGLSFSSVEVDLLREILPKNNFSSVPLFMYPEKCQHVPAFENRENIMFVGGFGHPPNLEAIEWFIQEVLPEINKKHPKIRLNIAGSNPPECLESYECENVKLLGFVSDDELAQLYQSSLINVVPLLHGAGVKGKVVESMYYQTPIVATSIAIEGIESLLPHFTPCDDVKSFADKVCCLIESQQCWQEHCELLGQSFDQEFVEENVKSKLLKVY